MTEIETQAMHLRLREMSPDELNALDPIAYALRVAMDKMRPAGVRAVTNRVIALACLDLAIRWEREVLSRE